MGLEVHRRWVDVGEETGAFVDAIAVEDIGGWRYFGALPLADAAARVARTGLQVLTGSTIGAPPHGQDRRGINVNRSSVRAAPASQSGQVDIAPSSRLWPVFLGGCAVLYSADNLGAVAGTEGRRAGDIFLSYRRDDTRHLAGRVYDRLAERFGDGRVFMDVDSIEPGLDFEAVINSAVASCGVMLALIGPTWLTAHDDRGRRRLDNPDDFIVLELSAALRHGIRVLPVLVDGAAPPQATDLPATLRPLARRHAIRLDHETFRSDVNELLTAVARVLERPSPPPEPRRPTQRPVSTGANPPTMWLAPEPFAAPSPEPAGSRREHPAAGERTAADGARPVEARPTSGRKRADGAVPAHTSRSPVLSAPLPAAAGALLVVTAVLIFIFTRPSDPGTGTPSPTTPSVSAISTKATAVAPFSTGITAITSTEEILTDPVGFVQSYYGLLPGNTDAAWALLGSTAQSQSGGRGAFDAFYAGVSRVWAENLRGSGNTVAATIVFTQSTGSVSRENYQFVLGTEDGRQVIESIAH